MLGQTPLGNVHLSHELKTNPQVINQAQWSWTCEFLSSYVAPDGHNTIQWVMPSGEVKRFKNGKLKKSEPKSLKDEWTAVKGKAAGDYVLSQKGAFKNKKAKIYRIYLRFKVQIRFLSNP